MFSFAPHRPYDTTLIQLFETFDKIVGYSAKYSFANSLFNGNGYTNQCATATDESIRKWSW